jgi:hypothetical protein
MLKTLFAFTLLTLCSAMMIPSASAWGFGKSPTWSGRIYADKISDVYQHIGEFKSRGACKKAVSKATRKRKNPEGEKYVCAFDCAENAKNDMRNICKEIIRVFP